MCIQNLFSFSRMCDLGMSFETLPDEFENFFVVVLFEAHILK